MVIDRSIVQAQPEQLTPRDVRIALLAARQHGVLSFEELLSCGLTPDAISVRVANGRLHPVHRGVYAVGHAKLTQDGTYLAAVKACGAGAVLSRFAAGAHMAIIDRV